MIDFLRLAKRYRIPYLEAGHPHCTKGFVQSQCPFCGQGGTHGGWYLGFSTERGNFVCWRCGGLRFWDTLAAILPAGADVRAIVAEFQKGGPKLRRIALARASRLDLPPVCGPMGIAHKKYLLGRRFDPDALADRWGLLGTGHTGTSWGWRVIIPVVNGADVVVAYQGRAIGPEASPKYKMTDHDRCLENPDTFVYGLNKAVGDSVIVVEGAPGVWRLGPGAVATMGIGWKAAQANKLIRFKRRFILFDPEPKAQERAESLAAHLSQFPGATEVVSGFDTDPGEFSEELVKKIREELGVGR